MEFIAINLDDFHKNQKDAGTNASMVFIEASYCSGYGFYVHGVDAFR